MYCHAVLMTVTLSDALRLESMRTKEHFGFFGFHMNLRTGFYSAKTIKISIGITMNLYLALVTMNILTRLSLPIHEQKTLNFHMWFLLC
jgi:hypothetical protein